MSSADLRRRVFIIPGNGGGDVLAANWYKWSRDQINQAGVAECIACNMPDPGTDLFYTIQFEHHT